MSKIDFKNFDLIDENEVPERTRQSNWEAVFKRIPKGKAVVIPTDIASRNSVFSAVKRHQKRGRFKKYYSISRKLKGGKVVTYVVNPKEEEAK